mmetsp:Transcript_50270/g.106824  ORF Transcript_50270/g.106824 Transcript_50270/m.106824 type:complete len:181 (-) Transcript_50270:74-616(-)|eukprot:CAMPEP_0206425638 /NCGR_PEP_ID=MMETSP0324_2-20121206/3906_1 /ASSEMBLY_ACC=CAM_ASM_000836 /TAXON_ID=2866 /ORGANISM="Crypthecodinium cohnii, Strain Seligo" /LENGTH=180 /DNA_ID=CAMNT_0053890449 /DNA_START=276 /DNA_END=818 /DNA_ORIENTATION=+
MAAKLAVQRFGGGVEAFRRASLLLAPRRCFFNSASSSASPYAAAAALTQAQRRTALLPFSPLASCMQQQHLCFFQPLASAVQGFRAHGSTAMQMDSTALPNSWADADDLWEYNADSDEEEAGLPKSDNFEATRDEDSPISPASQQQHSPSSSGANVLGRDGGCNSNQAHRSGPSQSSATR